MKAPTLLKHLGSFPGASQSCPFGPDALVFKVKGKMYALVGETAEGELRVTLKCDPELASSLRATYDAVRPGHYMNKRHWNTVRLNGSIPRRELLQMLEHSYECVVLSLTRKDRSSLGR